MRARILLWVAAGCGRVGFDASHTDGIRSDSGPSDDVADAFDPSTVPWHTPRVLSELDDVIGAEAPTVTEDRLTIIWTSARPGTMGGWDLWTATRATPSAPFTNITNLTTLNSLADDEAPELSPDGTTLYFTSYRSGNWDLYTSSFSGGTWAAPTPISELNTPSDEAQLAVTPDGLTGLYVRGGSVFMHVTRATTAMPFGGAIDVPELTRSSTAASPSLGNGGAVVYFHDGTNTDRDIYVSRLDGATYTTPQLVTELQTTTRDADPFILGDETYMIYNCDVSICETTKP